MKTVKNAVWYNHLNDINKLVEKSLFHQITIDIWDSVDRIILSKIRKQVRYEVYTNVSTKIKILLWSNKK